MERQEVYKKLNEIFEDVLDIEDVELTDSTSADDIEEWDSLSHIQLIVAVEKAFKTKFTSLEIMKWKNVGELVDTIMSKCA
jgi:acyl carrier protein